MNGRIRREDTPEGRLAAAASPCMQRMGRCPVCRNVPMVPDYADLREFMLPYVLLELMEARRDEAERAVGATIAAQYRRVSDLKTALAMILERGESGRTNE